MEATRKFYGTYSSFEAAIHAREVIEATQDEIERVHGLPPRFRVILVPVNGVDYAIYLETN